MRVFGVGDIPASIPARTSSKEISSALAELTEGLVRSPSDLA
jgi:hypothetical protein